ncbi:MAG: N-6 DNA methylase [bacterium]
MEKLKAEIDGIQQEKKKSKRKKDGIYYTPEYITRYIVEQTVGKYLEENPDKLETIKILDPACGSGAFLNQAHNFLREQYKIRNEEKLATVKVDKNFNIFEHYNPAEINRAILLNNLYGVDLNEESTEITKLSLWLKTAKKTEPLQNLDNNIKCGNSLIDDPEIAGGKAFNWYKEFPDIFRKKELKAFHVTWATHNSRYSERMAEYNVKTGEPVIFDEQNEVLITTFIAQIINEDKLRVLAYNICGDHVHLALVCEENERDNIVRKIKGKSTQLYKQHNNINEEFHLWTQKYHSSLIEDEIALKNTLTYINNNRLKHGLSSDNKESDNGTVDEFGKFSSNNRGDLRIRQHPQHPHNSHNSYNKGLQPLVDIFVSSIEQAFLSQYEGGFDVIIGNPPYGAELLEINYFNNKFKDIISGELESYLLFYYQSLKNLLKEDGILGFITPDSWFTNKNADKFRKFIIEENSLIDIFDVYKPFTDAKDTRCHIVIIKKKKDHNKLLTIKQVLPSNTIEIYRNYEINLNERILIFENSWNLYITNQEYNIINKMKTFSSQLFELYNIKYGLRTGDNEKYITNEKTQYKIIAGSDIASRYLINYSEKYLKTNEGLPSSYFNENFSKIKIIIQYVRTNSLDIKAKWLEYSYIEGDFIPLNSLSYIYSKDDNYLLKYLLAILNSCLLNRYYRLLYTDVNVKPFYLSQLPIPKANKEQQTSLASKAEQMIELNKNLSKQTQSALEFLKIKYGSRIEGHDPLLKISQKLEKFYKLGANQFIEELKKGMHNNNKGVATHCYATSCYQTKS